MRTFIIVDLEATCYEGKAPKVFFSEIIEIGAVVFDPKTREEIAEYQCFVKPVLSPS